MKLPSILLKLTSIFFLSIFLSSCDASKDTTKTPRVKPEMTYNVLADLLRNQPGVKVNGAGNNVSIIIRGNQSLVSNNEPLFVLDGNIIGSTYAEASNGIDPNSIGSVRILTPANAGIYGSRGSNGVIVMKSKE